MSANKPSAEVFLSTVKKSGLVESDRLQKALTEFSHSNAPQDDSLAVAEFLVSGNVLSKWQAEKLLQGKHKGYFLGKYRLISLLGKGGMSSVFLAEHILMRRRCAIKVLPTKRVADSSYLARFHREAQAVAALDHPNIVRAYDVDHQVERDAEIHFLVMEYVEGASLQELVARDGPVGFDDAIDYMRQAALGLEHAHRAGMVHRDIKPGNLLVDRNGIVKLLDLGLARYFSSEEEGVALTIAHDEKVLGTADYLAPEQALDSHTVDHRADIYSLGCTLYFLLTGHPPFTEGTLAQRLMAHQTKDPRPVESDRPDTPPSLAALLRKMMAKKVEDRYKSAQEVAEVTLQWLADNAGSAWRQSHSSLLGGLRGSDTHLGQDTFAELPKGIPVAKPVVLMMSGPDEEPKTAIVARPDWPTGDLTVTEAEPELSAFLSQIDAEPTSQVSAPTSDPTPKSAASKPKSSTIAAKQPVESNPAVAVPNFDFLSGPAVETSALPSTGSNRPAATKQKSAAMPAAPPKSSGTLSAVKTVSTPPESPPHLAPEKGIDRSASPVNAPAFPTFDFAVPVVAPKVATASHESPTDTTAASSKSAKTKPVRSPSNNRLVAFASVALALACFLGAYLLGWIALPSKEIHDKPITLGKADVWAKSVIRIYGDQADYQSLEQALRDAPKYFHPKHVGAEGKTDVRILQVTKGEYVESIRIDGSQLHSTWPEGVVIRGEGTVVFKPADDGPVLSLKELTGLTVENLTFDANKQPIGIQVAGYVTGSRLTNLKVRGFTEAGLVLHGVQAFNEPFRVDDVHCESNVDAAVGVRIEPHAVGTTKEESNNISLRSCRFFGPLAAGVAIQGALPYKIAVRESIFVTTAAGIRFEGPGRWMDFSLTNNSFFQCPIGILFTAMPDAITSGLSIRRNLFVGTSSAEAVVQTGYNEANFIAMLSDPAGGLEWNWSDRTAPASPVTGEINLFAANGRRGDAAFGFASQNPREPKFLAPTEASQQKSIPNEREFEKPWIGAVGP